MRRALACFLFLGMMGALPAAQAETDLKSVSIVGTWTINVRDSEDCSFSGQATVSPTDMRGTYSAELTMRHDCPEFGGAAVAVQESTIKRLGNQVSVRSTIIDFPSGFSASYAPDDFALTLQSQNRMFGIQTDRYGRLPAEWVRQEGGIS